MPEQVALSDFMRDTWDDFKSPTTSTFTKNMSNYKNLVSTLEEVSMPLIPVVLYGVCFYLKWWSNEFFPLLDWIKCQSCTVWITLNKSPKQAGPKTPTSNSSYMYMSLYFKWDFNLFIWSSLLKILHTKSPRIFTDFLWIMENLHCSLLDEI